MQCALRRIITGRWHAVTLHSLLREVLGATILAANQPLLKRALPEEISYEASFDVRRRFDCGNL
jgi:hypothetical protein